MWWNKSMFIMIPMSGSHGAMASEDQMDPWKMQFMWCYVWHQLMVVVTLFKFIQPCVTIWYGLLLFCYGSMILTWARFTEYGSYHGNNLIRDFVMLHVIESKTIRHRSTRHVIWTWWLRFDVGTCCCILWSTQNCLLPCEFCIRIWLN